MAQNSGLHDVPIQIHDDTNNKKTISDQPTSAQYGSNIPISKTIIMDNLPGM